MGTRAQIIIKDEGKEIVRLHRQMDGYPTGLGREIVEAVGFRPTIVNGYGGGMTNRGGFFNGMGDLATYLIGILKRDYDIGSLYVTKAKDTGQDYTYTLSEKAGEVWLKVSGGCSYNGPISKFNPKEYE